MDRMARFGEQVSKIRGWIIERAARFDDGVQMSEAQRIEEVSHVVKKQW